MVNLNAGSHVNGSIGIISSIRTQNGNFNSGKQSSKLLKLFVDELQEIYWSEHALTNAIPSMIKNATSNDLIEALTIYLSETEVQIIRLEQVFDILIIRAAAKKCIAMEGLITDAMHSIEEDEKGALRDACIISAVQKIEHYEIAAYGTLKKLAEALDLDNAVDLLRVTLNAEMEADEILTEVEVAIAAIHRLKGESPRAAVHPCPLSRQAAGMIIDDPARNFGRSDLCDK